jgi:hypothetical protein
MGTLMPASENKIAHTLRSIFSTKERVMIKRSTKKQHSIHLHNFDLWAWLFPPRIQGLTQQHTHGKCTSSLSIPIKLQIKPV